MALKLKPLQARRDRDRLTVTFRDEAGVAREVEFSTESEALLLKFLLAQPGAQPVAGRLTVPPPRLKATSARLLVLAPDRGALELQLDPLFSVVVEIDQAALRQLQAQLLPQSQSSGADQPPPPEEDAPTRH